MKKTMSVEYYAKRKYFVDELVKAGKAKILGMDEYESFIRRPIEKSEVQAKDNKKDELSPLAPIENTKTVKPKAKNKAKAKKEK